MRYVPLYVYSEYSIKQSTCHIDKLINKVKELNYDSIAVTDNGVMHGAFKFYKAATKNNIKPIMGLKLQVNINNEVKNILLYAVNNNGYVSLLTLSSIYEDNKTALNLDFVRKYSHNLICIYPLEENNGYNLILNNSVNILYNTLNAINNIFYDFYVGYSIQSIATFNNLNIFVNNLSNYKGVCINPVLFINKNDVSAYTALKSILNGQITEISDNEKGSYLLNINEIMKVFGNYPNLINNTCVIADICNVTISFNGYLVPRFDKTQNSRQLLLDLVRKGIEKRFIDNHITNKQPYYDRLNYEFSVIEKMGFIDYFLIVADCVKYARRNNIPNGPRGSAASCLIAYCLWITDVDPLKYNLLFERFLNIERVSMPDIDIDFADDRKDQVVNYVINKYGPTHCTYVSAFQTYGEKNLLNDLAKIYKLEDNYKKSIAKEFDKLDEFNGNFDKLVHEDTTLISLCSEFNDIRNIINIMCVLHDLPSALSTHACAMIITENEIYNHSATIRVNDKIQTQFEASDLEELGLLKMDFLSLSNLTTIYKTFELIKKDNPNFSLDINENDPNVYNLLARGEVNEVFQISSEGFRRVFMEAKPSNFMDIAILNAVYRPGPMDVSPQFIKRKLGQEPVTYIHPDLEPILRDTYGLIVFQEQVMQICQKICGYSYGKADVIRRIISKKKDEDMKREEPIFISSAMNRGYSRDVAKTIFDYIVKFGDYGYNKAHSVAYAKIIYRTAFYKTYFLKYYYSVLIDNAKSDAKGINNLIRELKAKNNVVYSPLINYSSDHCIVAPKGIVLPYTIIKGINQECANIIIEEQNKNKFESYSEFVQRIYPRISKESIISLIHAGSLDVFNLTHQAMIDTIDLNINLIEFAGIPGLKEIKYSQDEYNYATLSSNEINALGFNVKYNFFDQYKGIYKEKGLLYIKNIFNKQSFKTIGVIKKINKRMDKNKEEMCFMMIEDSDSSCEVTVFAKVFKDVSNLRESDIIIIAGHIDTTRGNKPIADHITKL